MTPSKTPLQQKAYPSASAFDMAPTEEGTGAGAFGQTALLPRAVPGDSPAAGQGSAGQSLPGTDAGGQDVPAPSSVQAWGPLPVVSLNEVRDPQLRNRLAHLGQGEPASAFDTPAEATGPAVSGGADAPASAFDLAAVPTSYKVSSAFGPATDLSLQTAEPDEETSPVTAGTPTVDEATGLQQASYPSSCPCRPVVLLLNAPRGCVHP